MESCERPLTVFNLTAKYLWPYNTLKKKNLIMMISVFFGTTKASTKIPFSNTTQTVGSRGSELTSLADGAVRTREGAFHLSHKDESHYTANSSPQIALRTQD